MYLYKIINKISGTFYIGVTTGKLYNRYSAHKNAAKSGKKSKLYDAMRSYGIDNFTVEVVGVFQNKEELFAAENQILLYINLAGIKNYNIKAGGEHGWGIRNKEEWRAKLKVKRQGRTPAMGMKHSDENKKLFGEFGKLRWDIYGRYPDEVLNYGFSESHKKFGISKTHYYRLRKERLGSNES